VAQRACALRRHHGAFQEVCGARGAGTALKNTALKNTALKNTALKNRSRRTPSSGRYDKRASNIPLGDYDAYLVYVNAGIEFGSCRLQPSGAPACASALVRPRLD
jgi:hypothetical protein